ncbi:MAG: peptide ABC transporter substrate-binding protein [Treponemataceae bacterium]|nr:peptide ABC transporter substrate-binding protein [Treponemataceae bacterium]
MNRAFKNLFCLFSLVFLLSLSSFADEEEIKLENQRQLVILISNGDFKLDPHLNHLSTESQILDGLYEGLFSYNPSNLQAESAICENFKISRDKKTYTFFLRKEAKFSDGSPIKAQNVKDCWLRLLSTKGAPFASLLDCIAGACDYRTGSGPAESVMINVKDDYTLSVRLTQPTVYFPNILCHTAFSIVPEEKGVYSGAFTLEAKTSNEIVLLKNQNYWGAKAVYLPSIKFVVSEDLKENTYAYNNGQLDWIIDGIDFNYLVAPNHVSLSTQFGTEYFFFRTDHEPWNNPKLRLALLSAIDWEDLQSDSMVKALKFIVPLSGYPEIFGVPEYDIDASLSLLKEAGFENQNLSLVIAIPDSSYHKTLAAKLTEYWKKIGVELVVQTLPINMYLSAVSLWDAQLFVYSWIGDYADPMAFLELFRGNSSLNESHWQDEIYDQLLNESSKLEGQSRLELLSQAEQYLLDQGMVIPIRHTLAFNVLNKEVIKGWYDNPLNMHPLKYLYFGDQPKIQNLVILK